MDASAAEGDAAAAPGAIVVVDDKAKSGKFLHELLSDKPDSFEVKDGKYGKGMFATRAFSKGDILHRSQLHFIPDKPGNVLVRSSDGSSIILDVLTHSVARKGHDTRELYAYDAHMNHACEPNTKSANTVWTDQGASYDTLCLRDIAKDEEITCDYELFEWDCKDKGIDACACGTKKCRGRVWGFKHIKDVKLRDELLPNVEEWMQVKEMERRRDEAKVSAPAKKQT